MKLVSDILKRKGAQVSSIDPSVMVLDALRMMEEKNIGSVVVVKDGIYQGIFTERDYSRKVILKGRSSTTTTVGEIMDATFPKVNPSDSIEQCMELMSDNNIRYLPVFEEDKLCGILSINDVVRETILAQKETIDHLHTYIHSS